MKYSQYNHFVEMENVVLCFNAYNYSRLIIGKNAYQDYLSCKDNVEKLNTKNPNLHRTLEANGFIVTDENDEQKKYLSSVQERKFSKDRKVPYDFRNGRSNHIAYQRENYQRAF